MPLQELHQIDGYGTARPAAANASTMCAPSTYLSLPVDDVLTHQDFGLVPGASRVYDLGAGLGKTILRAVLLHGAAAGVGIELSETRWRAGCGALLQLDMLLGDPALRPRNRPAATVELRLGDALRADVDVTAATHVLLFATCFPGAVLEDLQSKLLRELPGGARIFCVGDRGIWHGRMELLEDNDGLTEGQASSPQQQQRHMVRLSEEGAGAEDDADIRMRLWRVDVGVDFFLHHGHLQSQTAEEL